MKIVIFNEPNYRTGGVESLYQLCDMINTLGGDGYIYFVNKYDNPVPDEYKKYNIKIQKELVDSPEYYYIIPEVWTERVNEFKNAKKSIWWLSVDNNHGKFNSFDDDKIIHFYQSEYAKDFLKGKGSKNILPIHDYIHGVEYDGTSKEKIVCYNPAKGKGSTEFIIKSCPDVTFIPLVNMNKSEMIDTLKRSMIYIDFGHHPGRDRIPREAALLHNIILTSKIGSAGVYEDVPIMEQYKYSYLNSTINIDINKILNDYNTNIKNFEFYISEIEKQQNNMEQEVRNIL
jgi:hypothetical protein